MKYNDLIDKCVEIRKTWNPIIQSLDAHADEFLKKFTDDNERIFIKQVFFGTYRYEEFIKVFNTALFKRSPAETNRNDAPVNGIFIYLVCFRLAELPFEEFKKIVFSQNPVKMHVLFQFLFNIELLQQYVRDDWCKIYDASYIDDVVIGGIERHLPIMAELLAAISMRATGKVTDFVSSLGSQNGETETKEKTWKPTETQPFNLSQPKVKALPEPIRIPKIVKSNPVPETIYATNLHEIENEKKKRKEEENERLTKTYQESKVQRFELQTEKRPTNLEKLKEDAEKKIQEETAFKTYHRTMPTFDHVDAEIKMNAATILKEEAIIKRSKQEEEDYLKQIEMNMRDSSEFEKWKKQMQEKDSLEKLEAQERKRVEMQLAREAAVKAVEEKNVRNRENVQHMKELSKKGKEEMEKMLEGEFEYRKQLKDTVMEARENAGIEKQKVVDDNRKMHDDMKKEKKERWFMKLEEDEVERKKREELISKIREMERRPIDRTKTFDATQTMGYGLLEEMSLAQLRERYEQMKIERQEETEKKRVENVQKRFDKDADLKTKAQEIQAVRQEQARLHQEKKMQKAQQAEEEKKLKQQLREKSLLEVHGKITKKKEDKTAELERIAKELREIKLKRQYLNADKAVLEAKAWKSLEDGAEREIKFRQNAKLIDQEGIESVLLRERKILAHRATTEIEAKLEYLRQYDRTLEEAKMHNEVLFREERELKKKNHAEIRSYEQAHLENMATRDPFKSKISALNLSKAKSTLNNSRRPVSSREEIVLPPSKYSDLGRTGIIIEERSENLEYCNQN